MVILLSTSINFSCDVEAAVEAAEVEVLMGYFLIRIAKVDRNLEISPVTSIKVECMIVIERDLR